MLVAFTTAPCQAAPECIVQIDTINITCNIVIGSGILVNLPFPKICLVVKLTNLLIF